MGLQEAVDEARKWPVNGKRLYPEEMTTEQLSAALDHIRTYKGSNHECMITDAFCIKCMGLACWREHYLELFEAEMKKRESVGLEIDR